MNVKLSFAPVSQIPADLLVVVLDDEKTLHAVDDPRSPPTWTRRAAAFKDKSLKREYYVTLPEGARAKALVVYWSPALKSWNLWENVKTFTAKALRLARDLNLPPGGAGRERRRRGPPRGQGGGGRDPGRLHLRQVQAGEGRLPEGEGRPHPARPPRPPRRRRGPQGPLRLGLRERERGPRPHQRAGRGGDPRLPGRARGGVRQGSGPGGRDPRSGGPQGPRLRGAPARGRGQRPPAAHGHPAPRARASRARKPCAWWARASPSTPAASA